MSNIDRKQIRKGFRILGKDAVALAAFLTLRTDGVEIPGVASWSPCGCFIGVVTVGGEETTLIWGNIERDNRAEVARYLGWRPWEVTLEEAYGGKLPVEETPSRDDDNGTRSHGPV